VLEPQAVAARFATEAAAQYVDVRTVAEFAQGRPLLRAVNVPFVFHHPLTMAPIDNASFVEIVAYLFPPSTPLVLGAGGAEDDQRVLRAAERLAAEGYPDVAVLARGFEGWRSALLPTTRDNRDGVSYVSLLTRFRRKDKRAGKAGGH
jgi:rhodanese-related sulfurtransferase